MSLLTEVFAELNGFITALGGIAVIILFGVITQKLHERKLRKMAEEQLRLQKLAVKYARLTVKQGNGIYHELRILNAIKLARGGRK